MTPFGAPLLVLVDAYHTLSPKSYLTKSGGDMVSNRDGHCHHFDSPITTRRGTSNHSRGPKSPRCSMLLTLIAQDRKQQDTAPLKQVVPQSASEFMVYGDGVKLIAPASLRNPNPDDE